MSLTTRLLDAAVASIGGQPREGQARMAAAIEAAIESGQHLLVQAGTGTGKSLGYLAPVLAHLARSQGRAVIATATLALQHQLADKDIPTALVGLAAVNEQAPSHAILKGRTNYVCLLKVRGGSNQDSLLDPEDFAATGPESELGAEVMALRRWAETELEAKGLADRDDAPSHTARGWAQVSIPVRECLGVQRCPFSGECFVERSREKARSAQLIVTNHALLAIDAMHGHTALPEHDLVVIDEAHELSARVTSAATNDLSPTMVERAAKRVLNHISDDDLGVEFFAAADALRAGLDSVPVAQITDSNNAAVRALELVRDTARKVVSAVGSEGEPEKLQAGAAAKEVFDFAERMAKLHPNDVVWISESDLMGRQIHVAPLDVANLMRDLFGNATAVLTSATLSLGGSFDPWARSVGLRPGDTNWQGLDVGSPFDYATQGILYVPTDLQNPGRDGISAEQLKHVAELVWAAGGRTLGLFASRRSAEAAAQYVRQELPKLTVLCQGEAQLSELTGRFIDEPDSCLFGTMSLWQGVDIAGDVCQLVIIDKIPFPRPDDPLMQARQRAVTKAGGNGFMSVAATYAALLLAQGSGRLIRRSTDRGVVAILDPRLVRARYGSFLRASMPGFWRTSDLEIAVSSLRRLASERA